MFTFQAALTALRALAEMGLDSVAPTAGGMKKESVQQGNQGDGYVMLTRLLPTMRTRRLCSFQVHQLKVISSYVYLPLLCSYD